MSKIAVIYWSQTGNTEMMANAIAEGIREAGAECDVLSVPAVSADQATEYEKLALGCPAMGAEVLEEMDFEPFFTELERRLSGPPSSPVRLVRLGRRPVDAGLGAAHPGRQRQPLPGTGSDDQRDS